MASRFAVGDRVDGLYDGNSDDAWYPGVVRAAHADDGTFDVLYDDGEAEHHVVAAFLRAHREGTLCVGTRVFGRCAGGDEWYAGRIHEVQDDGAFTIEYDDGEVETGVALDLIRETLPPEEEHEEEDGQSEQPGQPPAEAPDEATQHGAAGGEAAAALEPDAIHGEAREDGSDEIHDEAREERSAPLPIADAPRPVEPRLPPCLLEPRAADEDARPRRRSRPPASDDAPPVLAGDEYAGLVATMERLESCAGDALTAKTLLSTLVKQMRSLPQATADLVHSRGGEALLLELLRRHHAHAVIQCYGFVLLRRLCFLCGKSTHFFLRSGVVDLVTVAMHKFPEDAILQASACGALAVFTRVHAGLATLLELRVSHLVLATIIFHKAYSVHTRQVHYYACEVLLELCELGDRTTIEALCGDGLSGPGLSDLSPLSLLLFLLRQALTFEDKKASCASGTLLMCLASCHRHAAQILVDLNGLSELSTVMAKYPGEPRIQKYAASASKEIALCSMDPPHASSPQRRNQQSKAKSSAKRRAPHTQRSAMNGFPSPSHQQQIGSIAATARDSLSFSKYTSPIGKAPHLPPNIRPFTDAKAPSPSSFVQREQAASPLVILDGNSHAPPVERKKFLTHERQNLLFETYGVDAKVALDHHRTQGIKRRQLKTHIVSASSVSDGIQWASPVKAVVLQEPKPLSSRSDKATAAKPPTDDARRVRSSGEVDAVEGEPSPATLRRQQAKTTKRIDEKTPRASFRLKLDGACGAATPIALSPKTSKADSSRGKTKSKSTKVAAGSTSSRAQGVGSNVSTESLNSYAAQLFKEEMEAPEQVSAAQERERLSFADKLHKMIDKAKSSLAHSTATLRTPDKQNSPVKRITKQSETGKPTSANTKRKQQQPTSMMGSSRVAPASTRLNPTPAVPDPAASTGSKKPAPPVAAKPTPAKKVAAPSPAVSRQVAPPKSVKPSAPTTTRSVPTAVVSVVRAKPTITATKPASTAKPTSAKPPAKSFKPAESTVAAAAVGTAAIAAVAVVELVTVESTQESSIVTAVETDAVADEEVSSASEDVTGTSTLEDPTRAQNEPIITTPSSENLSVDILEPKDSAIEQSIADSRVPTQVDEIVAEDNEAQVETEPVASTITEASTSVDAEANADNALAASEAATMEDAVAVVTSAADDLYADEYNEFDDADNAAHILDDEAADPTESVDRDVSFEALMSLTAQVTEFTAASDPILDAPLQDEAEKSTYKAKETAAIGATVTTESEPASVPCNDESPEAAKDPTLTHEVDLTDVVDVGETAPQNVDDNTLDPIQPMKLERDVTEDKVNDESNEGGAVPTVIESDQVNPVEATPETAEKAVTSLTDESSTQANDQPEESEPTNVDVATPVDQDRPESRQTELSYADEDFDDSPEDDGDEATPEEAVPAADVFTIHEFSAAQAMHDEVVEADAAHDQNLGQDQSSRALESPAIETELVSSSGPGDLNDTGTGSSELVSSSGPDDLNDTGTGSSLTTDDSVGADNTVAVAEEVAPIPAVEIMSEYGLEDTALHVEGATPHIETSASEVTEVQVSSEGQTEMADGDNVAEPLDDEGRALTPPEPAFSCESSVDHPIHGSENPDEEEVPAITTITADHDEGVTDLSYSVEVAVAHHPTVTIDNEPDEERTATPDGYGDTFIVANDILVEKSPGDGETDTGPNSGEETQVDQSLSSQPSELAAHDTDQEPPETTALRDTARSTSPESYGDDSHFEEDAQPEVNLAGEERHVDYTEAEEELTEESPSAVVEVNIVESNDPGSNNIVEGSSGMEPFTNEKETVALSANLPDTENSVEDENRTTSGSDGSSDTEQLSEISHDNSGSLRGESAVLESDTEMSETKLAPAASNEELEPLDHESRPSTADEYDQTFEGDNGQEVKPRQDQEAEEEAVPQDEDAPNVEESSPPGGTEEEAKVEMPTRPSTADAYGDDTEFEGETARGAPFEHGDNGEKEVVHLDDTAEPLQSPTKQEIDLVTSPEACQPSRPPTADPYNDIEFENNTAREILLPPKDIAVSEVVSRTNSPPPQDAELPPHEFDLLPRPTTADPYGDDAEYEDDSPAGELTTSFAATETAVIDNQAADIKEEAASAVSDPPAENVEPEMHPVPHVDQSITDDSAFVDQSSEKEADLAVSSTVEVTESPVVETQVEVSLPDEVSEHSHKFTSDQPVIDSRTEEVDLALCDQSNTDESLMQQFADHNAPESNDLHDTVGPLASSTPNDSAVIENVNESVANEPECTADSYSAADNSSDDLLETNSGKLESVNLDGERDESETDEKDTNDTAHPEAFDMPGLNLVPGESTGESVDLEDTSEKPLGDATEADALKIDSPPPQSTEDSSMETEAIEMDRGNEQVEDNSRTVIEETETMTEYGEEEFGPESGDASALIESPRNSSETAQVAEVCEADQSALAITAQVDLEGQDDCELNEVPTVAEISPSSGDSDKEGVVGTTTETAEIMDESVELPESVDFASVEAVDSQVPDSNTLKSEADFVEPVAVITPTEPGAEDIHAQGEIETVQQHNAGDEEKEGRSSPELHPHEETRGSSPSESILDKEAEDVGNSVPAEVHQVAEGEATSTEENIPGPNTDQHGEDQDASAVVETQVHNELAREELGTITPRPLETEEISSGNSILLEDAQNSTTSSVDNGVDSTEVSEAQGSITRSQSGGDFASIEDQKGSPPTEPADGNPEPGSDLDDVEAVAEEGSAPSMQMQTETNPERRSEEDTPVSSDSENTQIPTATSAISDTSAVDLAFVAAENMTEENVSSSRSDEYPFDDETTSELPVTTLPPAELVADDDESAYKDEDNEFEDDGKASDPPPSLAPTEATESASPPSDDVEYDDFESDEPPAAKTRAPEPAKADDDDQDVYNDFEDDDEPTKAPKAKDEAEDAYEMEEAFEEDDKTPPRIPEPTVVPVAAKSADPVPLETPSTPTAEEGEYDEYDDFED